MNGHKSSRECSTISPPVKKCCSSECGIDKKSGGTNKLFVIFIRYCPRLFMITRQNIAAMTPQHHHHHPHYNFHYLNPPKRQRGGCYKHSGIKSQNPCDNEKANFWGGAQSLE